MLVSTLRDTWREVVAVGRELLFEVVEWIDGEIDAVLRERAELGDDEVAW